MPLLPPMLVVPTSGDGAAAVAAGAAAAHDVSKPPIVPPTHSTPGPSSAPQVTPVREPTLVRDPTPVTEEAGPTTSTRPPSLTRHTSVHEDISEGGGDFVSSPQSRVKPMTKTQQRDYMREFVKNNSASVYNQGWTMKKVKALSIAQLRIDFEYIQQHLERSNLLNFRRSTFRPKPTLDAPSTKRANQGAPQVPAASSQVPVDVPAALLFLADILVLVVFPAHAADSVPTETVVHTTESHLDDPLTASEHVSTEPTGAAPTPSSSGTRRKHIAKKRVTPIVDMADAAMIKFDSDSDSDDDPLPYAPYAGWDMVPSLLGSVHAYHDMAWHTKHFTTLRKLLYIVEKTDLQKLLGAVDKLYQKEEPDTFSLLLWGDLHVLFQSLDDEDALDFWRNQDSWRIRSWRLYPRAQVHVLEMVDGQSWLVKEQTTLGKDKSNPLTVGSLLKTTWSSIHHLLTDEVLTSPEQMATGLASPRVSGYLVKAYKIYLCCCEDWMLLFHDPAVFGVPADLFYWSPYSCWFLVAAAVGCCWYVVPAGR
nr:hypothetical protein [Tanacetum cinerariifolium]